MGLFTPSKKTVCVGILNGTVRPGGNSAVFAEWVWQLATNRETPVQYELISLASLKLPLLDEPGVPMISGATLPHSKQWAAKVASLDGFIFVTPQYNWGYPAPLKNALDFLYREWNHKPAAIVTFRGHGGGKCAQQLEQVLEGLKMRVVPKQPGITFADRSHALGGLTLPAIQQGYSQAYAAEVLEAVTQLEAALLKPQGAAADGKTA